MSVVANAVPCESAGPYAGMQRWSTSRLAELVPGTTRVMWTRWAPALCEAGVLRRVGRGWLGVAEEIVDALPDVVGPKASEGAVAA